MSKSWILLSFLQNSSIWKQFCEVGYIYNLSPRWIDWAAAVKLRAWLPNILLPISEFVRKSQSEMPNKMKWLKSIKQRTLFLKHKYFLLTVKFCDIDMRSWYMNLKDADIKQNKISDLHMDSSFNHHQYPDGLLF